MSEIKVHIFHTGEVCVAPELPFGGEHCSALRVSGVLAKKSERLWLPIPAYLIECAHGNVLFDCGWHRDMSPHCTFDRRAQICSPVNRIRCNADWWRGTKLRTFGWNDLMGPAGRSYDVFGSDGQHSQPFRGAMRA